MSSSGQSNSSAPSGVPASLGPGARQTTPANAETTDPTSLLKQIAEIRSHYIVTLDDSRSNLSIGFELNGRSRQFSIPFANMPLGSSAQWLLYGGPARRFTTGVFVTDIIRGAERMAYRNLTQVEAEGYACHGSRRMLYSFSAVASSICIGGGMGYVGRTNMKFPFMKPKPMERYDIFPSRFMPVLKGPLARSMWHITRINVYTFLSFLLLQPLYSSMGDNAMTVGLYRDSRTTEVLKECKANKDRDSRPQSNHRIFSNVEPKPSSQRTKSQQQQQSPSSGQYQDPDPEGYYNDSQDNAPNDYSGGRTYDTSSSDLSSFNDSTTDTDMLTDAQMRTRESDQSSPSSFSGNPTFQNRPQPPQPAQRQTTWDSDFFFDDASTTAGNDPNMPTSARASYGSSGGGSAWERVRRTGPPPSSADSALGNRRMIGGAQREQSQSSRDLQRRDGVGSSESSADSFSFAKGDEERQLAKQQAQRDFDRMVDAERRGSGGDGFTSSGGEQTRSVWEGRRNK